MERLEAKIETGFERVNGELEKPVADHGFLAQCRDLLACQRDIELNPVRVWMVSAPQDYP